MISVLGFHFRYQQAHKLAEWQVPEERLAEFYSALKNLPGLREAVFLSTCNRCELYVAADDSFEKEVCLNLWRSFCPKEPRGAADFTCTDKEAIRHLFRVAASLDSMVVGETEILGQVRQTYRKALEQKATGPILNRIFQKALASAKRIRTETGLGKNPVSVGTVAIKLAEQIFGDFSSTQAMVLGTGEMGGQIAEYLSKRRVRSLWLSNRSPETARKLARRLKAEAVPFEKWLEKLPEVDMLLTCARSAKPILSASQLELHLGRRHGRKLFLVDLGVPQNVETLPHNPEGFYHYNMDDLKTIAEANGKLRQQERVFAEKLLEENILKVNSHLDTARQISLLGVLKNDQKLLPAPYSA